MQSNAEAEPKVLCYKNSHKCYSVLFLNQLTYVNEDPDWALGSSQKTSIKGVTVLINVGADAKLGVKRNQKGEWGDGEVERCSMAINICRHQYLALLALQPPQWGDGGEGLRRSGRGLLPCRRWKPGAEIRRLCQGRNPWRDTVGSHWLVGLSDQTCHTCLGHGCRCSRSALTVVINRWQLTV